MPHKVPPTANTDESKEVAILTEIYEYIQRDPSFLGILNRIFKEPEQAIAELKQIVD